jgi:hypothetical protein
MITIIPTRMTTRAIMTVGMTMITTTIMIMTMARTGRLWLILRK